VTVGQDTLKLLRKTSVMNQKKETTALLLSLLIAIGAITGGLRWLDNKQQGQSKLSIDLIKANILPGQKSTFNSAQISQGSAILITQDITPEKQAAVQAIATQEYIQAVSQLEQSLIKQPNDPEALIYLNNARIAEGKAYNLAVPVPIGTEITTAQEILRGVAQAQTEINQQGGINGVPIKITIANDDNDPETAKQIAESFAKNKDILGVIGHFASDITLAVAPIYEQNGLVAISATSTSISLSDAGNYIFRTVPSDRFTSNALAQYALNQLNQNQVALIYNSQSAYSQSLRDTFTTDLVSNGGEIVFEADLSQGNFNPAEMLQQANNQGAKVLVFLNDSQTLDKAYLLMQLNNRQLPMLGGDGIYRPQTLQVAGEKSLGIVLGVPWHILGNHNSNFPTTARRLWGGDVSWRTAMAYDTTKALIAGLSNDPSRQGIQQTLSQPDFAFEGASGTVKFLASGDRNQAVQLVTVQVGKRSSFGYDFVPLK
jgi:branched-chain amino acid transport system substrate-binding protein